MSKRKKKKNKSIISFIIIIIAIVLYSNYGEEVETKIKDVTGSYASYTIEDIPSYNNSAYIEINNNEPVFSDEEKASDEFESYGDLDALGRCSSAIANIGIDLMPTLERTSIGSVKPTAWHTVKYDIIEGKYLYNRCHLIGYQLTGENANKKNLITCTRQMNVGVMLDYENMVAEYIKETNNHVLYRVTPIFEGDNLLATGVQMEGYSLEDNGEGIKFNIFVYNVQDGIDIDYKTGDSSLAN